MSAALVPSNHRLMEHALAESLTAIAALEPNAIEMLWDAWRCPSALLPFLAYSLSVDLWDDGWDEVRQRQAIAESPAYHQRKGTAAAVDEAAAFTQRPVTILEWHDFIPEGRRGTFAVTVHPGAGESMVPASEITILKRLITSAKPKSRAFCIQSGQRVDHDVPIGVGLMASGGAMLLAAPDALETKFNPAVWLRRDAGVPLEVS
jgi:phage tail P2-like protein